MMSFWRWSFCMDTRLHGWHCWLLGGWITVAVLLQHSCASLGFLYLPPISFSPTPENIYVFLPNTYYINNIFMDLLFCLPSFTLLPLPLPWSLCPNTQLMNSSSCACTGNSCLCVVRMWRLTFGGGRLIPRFRLYWFNSFSGDAYYNIPAYHAHDFDCSFAAMFAARDL